MSENYPHKFGVSEVHLPNGAVNRIPTQCIAQIREIYCWQVYNQHLKVEDLKDKIVFDVGGMAGVYAIMASFAGAKCVVTVEPNVANYALLQENIRLNKLENIISVPMAAINQNGVELKLFSNPGPGSDSVTLFVDHDKFDMVPGVTLDALALQHGIPDFVKMDIEGGEGAAMEGAKTLLKLGKTEFSVATYHSDRIHKQVLALFEKYEYETEVFGSGGQGGLFVNAWPPS